MAVKIKIILVGWVLLGTLAFWANGHWLGSLWPSLVALAMVYVTGRALLGLLCGSLVGALLLDDRGLHWVLPDLVGDHLLPNFGSTWKTGAILFTLILGGFVAVLEKTGVFQAFFRRIAGGADQRRSESVAMGFGLVCFFDGLANSLLVGKIFDPVARAGSIRRVRLAYIVDTTSAAVACLAVISTWIAFQLSMIAEGYRLAGFEESVAPYRDFFASIPYNSYAIFSLILLAWVIWRQWDIGPMRHFAAARESYEARAPGAAMDDLQNAQLWRVGVPLAALIGLIFSGIYLDGVDRMESTIWPVSAGKLSMAFGAAAVPVILVTAAGMASAVAILCFPGRAQIAWEAFREGTMQMIAPLMILVAAWMLSSTLEELEAGAVLGGLLEGRLSLSYLPAVVFVTGALVSFTTGTSWGTMGLLMPLAIPVAFELGGEPASTLIPVVVAAVFSGAVFGDHCSPLSDTTIVSSFACGVEPLDHVKTQLPYAGIAAAGALLFGFLPAGWIQMGAIHLVLGGGLFGIVLWLAERFSKKRLYEKMLENGD